VEYFEPGVKITGKIVRGNRHEIILLTALVGIQGPGDKNAAENEAFPAAGSLSQDVDITLKCLPEMKKSSRTN
jgi:hypothetical protein